MQIASLLGYFYPELLEPLPACLCVKLHFGCKGFSHSLFVPILLLTFPRIYGRR